MDACHPNEDRNFDDLADRFKRNIYGSTKGKLRLELLMEDLSTHLPELFDGKRSLKILDAGCGMAQIGCQLARLGHEMHFCDISTRMLEMAREEAEQAGVLDRCRFTHGSFQELVLNESGPYDVIISHAVLEWLVDPKASLEVLASSLAPGGALSLMFYNINCLVYRNAILGNYRKVMSGEYCGIHKSFTPINPLKPDEVLSWVGTLGMDVLQKTGIRVFTEYMRKDLLKSRAYEDTLAVEKIHCREEPFASMGRYLHLLCRKNIGQGKI